MLACAGVPVTLIGRPAHVDAIRRDGLRIERSGEAQSIAIASTTDCAAVKNSNVILFCPKSFDTGDTAAAIAPHLAPAALILSLQNGVDNVERIQAATGAATAAAVVYVAVSLPAPGLVRHAGRGDLVVGFLPEAKPPESRERPALEAVAQQFERAGVPCRLAVDVRGELWAKLTLNCAYNALSAIGRTRYGDLIASAEVRDFMVGIVAEVVAVARASGIELAQAGLTEATLRLGETMPGATSSTAQDLARGKPTEIDALNGFIVRQGEKLGVATPCNRAMYVAVQLLERSLTA
jgi:2-dehydropantoate 2-reductase